MSSKHRRKPELPLLSLPNDSETIEIWWDKFSDTNSIDEIAEYDCGQLNLGAESPLPSPADLGEEILAAGWSKAATDYPRNSMKRPSWRSLTYLKDRNIGGTAKKDVVDRDCGICFEYAVTPCRTLCCGRLFCQEHISDWLHGPSSDGRCPSCELPCSLENGTLSLSPLALKPNGASPKQHAGSYPQQPVKRYKTPTEKLVSAPPISGYSRGRSLLRPPSRNSSLSSASLSLTISTIGPATPNEGIKISWISLPLDPAALLPSDFFEALSRITSIVGLTLFLYVLLS